MSPSQEDICWTAAASLTVEEVMALAGNGGHAAAMKRAQLVRTMDDGRKESITIPVNLIYKGQAPDVAMKDGDILYVPTSNGRLITEQAITSALGIRDLDCDLQDGDSIKSVLSGTAGQSEDDHPFPVDGFSGTE